MELIILRHGEAGTRIPMASQDSERALTVEGRREVEEIAKSLKQLNVEVHHIVTSPLTRSLETAQIVAKELNKSKDLESWDELKPEGERLQLFKRLSKLREDSSVLIVGHEPYLSMLLSDLISGNPRGRISLKKAGMAKVTIDSLTPKASGELKWLLTPRQIKKLS
ncbi:MAG: phosphohistidine phosphatase SixA [Thaumarchaeota archaeon]|nr:phosphohistidine phosphatase SixA [Nitrososphaerota archaeon]